VPERDLVVGRDVLRIAAEFVGDLIHLGK